MNVSEAVAARTTIRRFSNQTVDDELVKALLEKSARAPSGGNLQPWRIFVITSDTMLRFLEHVQESEFQKDPPMSNFWRVTGAVLGELHSIA